jgi:transposase
VLHLMAVVQLRSDTEGRGYYDRKIAAGKYSMEAMRCLKRRLSDVVYKTMRHDADRLAAGPGTHSGALLTPARSTQTPTSTLRRSHFPDPPYPTLPRPTAADQTVLRPVPDAVTPRLARSRVKRILLDHGKDQRMINKREQHPP